jgi:hypothetical protein
MEAVARWDLPLPKCAALSRCMPGADLAKKVLMNRRDPRCLRGPSPRYLSIFTHSGVDSARFGARTLGFGSVHPPPAPYGDGERINLFRALAIGERSATQAPIFSVRR